MTATSPRTEESDPFCLHPARAAQLLADAPWRRFAAIGDSLSAGTGDPSPGYATLPWAPRVADTLRRVRPDLAYLNTAWVGARATQTLATQADQLVAFRPDLVHVSCGANDVWQREPDFADIERDLRRVFDLAAGTGAQLTTFTLAKVFVVPKYPDFRDRVVALNKITRTLADEYDAVLIDMWDHPIMARPNLLSADRIHLSMSGHAVMASEVVLGLAGRLALRHSPCRNQTDRAH
ncbi:SGNH/GDSL hydrolase family protein [Solihabitans fulvus]|uniref:SGNH/GDSL hydrolase family protein n=1 Tax=Solihabitans fulvus TaxID=1892852 RepID=A0A5B2W1Z8_9PSEU|nr:SGNH/GDSL hydrolase family protein [Solihabitans fulvus]KAA2245983.1 SGNH/GDSL hydrolase family protein [Solihabitans fulvus]